MRKPENNMHAGSAPYYKVTLFQTISSTCILLGFLLEFIPLSRGISEGILKSGLWGAGPKAGVSERLKVYEFIL